MHESDETWMATKDSRHLEMFIDHVNVCVSRVNTKYVFVVAGWVLHVHFLEDAIYLITTITLTPRYAKTTDNRENTGKPLFQYWLQVSRPQLIYRGQWATVDHPVDLSNTV